MLKQMGHELTFQSIQVMFTSLGGYPAHPVADLLQHMGHYDCQGHLVATKSKRLKKL